MNFYWQGVISGASTQDSTITYGDKNVSIPPTLSEYLRSQPIAGDKTMVTVTKPNIFPLPEGIINIIVYMRGVIDATGRVGDFAASDAMKCEPKLSLLLDRERYETIFLANTRVPHTYDMGEVLIVGYNILDFLSTFYTSQGLPKSLISVDFERLKLSKSNIGLTLRYKKLNPDVKPPKKEHFSDSGFDINLIELKKVENDIYTYGTGLELQIPFGYRVDIYPRSSLSKSGYSLSNSIGVIDGTYRGELLVKLRRHGDAPELSLPYTAVQLILAQNFYPSLQEVKETYPTTRDSGGFGSTDNKH